MSISRRVFMKAASFGTVTPAHRKAPSRKNYIEKMTLPAVATPLSTSGRYVIGSDGHRVKLTGVTWGGAYQDSMVCSGLDFLNRSAIAEQLASWGFNVVRLPFASTTVLGTSVLDPSTVTANPDMAGMTPWQAYQSVVAALTSAGVMVIPNAHLMYRGWCCSLADTNGLWWNANHSYSEFLSVWQTVATTFKNNPMVVGYDLKNEPREATISGKIYNPAWGNGNTQTDFRWLYTQIGNAVQAIDNTKLIICEGLNSASDLTGVRSNPVTFSKSGKVVYSIHDYPQGHSATETVQNYYNTMLTNSAYLLNNGIAPLWVGEFGLANDSMSAIGGSYPMSCGNGLGAGPVSQSYGNWWNNFVNCWYTNLDADWCCWQLSGTHVQGTEPSTNKLMYNRGDRVWNGLYSQDWSGPANPAQIEAIQAIMPKLLGP